MTSASEKRSLRASTSCPRACSGDMKLVLPLTMPTCVCVERPRALTMPKSNSFTSPSSDIMMLPAETSRWTMPIGSPSRSRLVCAYSSASSVSCAM